MPGIRVWRYGRISVTKHTDLSSVLVDASHIARAVFAALGTVKAGSTVAVLILVLGRLCSFGVCRSVGSASGGNVGGIVLWRLCIIRGRLRRNVAIFAYTLFCRLKRAGAGVAALGADKAVVELCVASVANRVLGVYVILLVYAKLAAAMAADKRSGVTGVGGRVIGLGRYDRISVTKNTDLSAVLVDALVAAGAVLAAFGTVKAGASVTKRISIVGDIPLHGVFNFIFHFVF